MARWFIGAVILVFGAAGMYVGYNGSGYLGYSRFQELQSWQIQPSIEVVMLSMLVALLGLYFMVSFRDDKAKKYCILSESGCGIC
jgi:hypothetical protein